MLPTQGKLLLLITALAVAAAFLVTPGPAAADRTIDAREFVILSDDIYKQMTEVEHAEGLSGGIVNGGSDLLAPSGGDGSGGDSASTGGSIPGDEPTSGSKGKGPGNNDNRSGLGDETNPGQGGGSENSPNQGTDNPNNKKK